MTSNSDSNAQSQEREPVPGTKGRRPGFFARIWGRVSGFFRSRRGNPNTYPLF